MRKLVHLFAEVFLHENMTKTVWARKSYKKSSASKSGRAAARTQVNLHAATWPPFSW